MAKRLLYSLLVVAAAYEVAHGKTYTSQTYGYSLDYPDSWEQIPAEDVEAATSGVIAGNNPAIMDAAFQPPDAPTTFDWPRIVVAVVPYSAIGFNRQLTESEIKEVSAKFAGLDSAAMQEVAERKLTQNALDRISVNSVGEFILDMPNHRFIWSAEMDNGEGPVIGWFVMAFGNRHWVNASYWVRKDETAGSEPIRQQFMDSLQFTSANAYSVVASDRNTPPPWWQEALEKGLVGALSVLFLGAISFAFHVINGIGEKKESPPKQESKTSPQPQPPKATTPPPLPPVHSPSARAICGNCGGRFKAPAEAIGKRTKCPKCGTEMEVQAKAARL